MPHILSFTKERSLIAGYYYLVNRPNAKPHTELNCAIIIKGKNNNNFVAYTAETETGGGFHNTQMAIPI